MDARPLGQRLVDGADRRGSHRAPAVLPELDPDGGPRRRDLDRARGAQRLRADQVALPRRRLGVRPPALRLLHPVPDGADPDGAAARA